MKGILYIYTIYILCIISIILYITLGCVISHYTLVSIIPKPCLSTTFFKNIVTLSLHLRTFSITILSLKPWLGNPFA